MPSNIYRPLTKPQSRGKAATRNLVPLINRALTFFSALYIVISSLSSIAPSSSVYYTKSRTGDVCDPFYLPGFSSKLPSGLATFRTYDPSCPVPGLLSTLLSLLPSSPYFSTAIAPAQSHSRKYLTDKIANKTVLLIGDTVDETFVDHFCTLIGRTTEFIDQRHPWGEAWTKVPAEHLKVHGSNMIAKGNPGDKILAHYCYEPHYDFLITSAYHYGTDLADSFLTSPRWTAPTLFEHRVEDLYVKYMRDLASPHPASPSLPPPRSHAYPDLTIFSSSFWDLARFSQEDTMSLRSLSESLSEDRLFKWRARNVDMLHSLNENWRDTKLAWRSLHYPGDNSIATVEWWSGLEKEGSK
ncbi:hypothetical protein CBS101457_000765 [Exobasidium rhododendri]|nr:hypothetical protein CBS101457_000765 [Exobasidium rhododendri]